jgi:hypothetical protein
MNMIVAFRSLSSHSIDVSLTDVHEQQQTSSIVEHVGKIRVDEFFAVGHLATMLIGDNTIDSFDVSTYDHNRTERDFLVI